MPTQTRIPNADPAIVPVEGPVEGAPAQATANPFGANNEQLPDRMQEALRRLVQQFSTESELSRRQEIRRINDTQKEVFFNKVRAALWTLRGKRLAALGLAFKGGTDDIRESPALDIVEHLLKEGSTVSAYDPAASERSKEVIPPSANMKYVDDPYAAAHDADALLILSDWQEFGELDLDRLHYTLRYPIIGLISKRPCVS